MMTRSWFSALFDSEWRQRADINQQASEIEFVRQYSQGMDENHRLLRQQVIRLATTVEVLLDLLEEKGLLDDTVIEARVQAALAPKAPPVTTAGLGDGPYRGGGPAAAPPAMTTCVRCKSQVPLSSTTVFEEGNVCDRCAGG